MTRLAPKSHTFSAWDATIGAIVKSVQYFEEHHEHELTAEDREIYDKGNHSLLVVGDANFHPDYQRRANMEMLIGRLTRLCDMMAAKLVPHAQISASLSPEFAHAQSLIMARSLLSGLPPNSIMKALVDTRYFPTTQVYKDSADAVNQAGGSMRAKMTGQNKWLS